MNQSMNFYLTEINICECSCKHVLLGSIIGALLLFNIILVIYVVWNNKRGKKFLVFLEVPSNSLMHFFSITLPSSFMYFFFDRNGGKAKVSLIAMRIDLFRDSIQ